MANFVITFRVQKPADLEGMCPFTVLEQLCPYGLTCRFLSTHKDSHVASENPPERNHEINTLNKDIQKLLWKNKYKFPKASAQIKLLGLKVHNYFLSNSNCLSDLPIQQMGRLCYSAEQIM